MTVMLLSGLFVVPMLLLRLGYRLRRRPAWLRGVFWGGLTGHSLGMLVALAAAHYPPVQWGAGGWRALAVHASLLIGAVLGAAVGAVRGAGPRSSWPEAGTGERARHPSTGTEAERG
jgi:hypothetical protein